MQIFNQSNWHDEIQFVNKFEFPILVKYLHAYQVRRRDQLALVPSAGGGSHAVWHARQGSACALAVIFCNPDNAPIVLAGESGRSKSCEVRRSADCTK
jgi:hypothetical protein